MDNGWEATVWFPFLNIGKMSKKSLVVNSLQVP
jgi:hypothetical protein